MVTNYLLPHGYELFITESFLTPLKVTLISGNFTQRSSALCFKAPFSVVYLFLIVFYLPSHRRVNTEIRHYVQWAQV
jgi:hypothetical protein